MLIKELIKSLKRFLSFWYNICQLIEFLLFLSITIASDVLWMRIVFGILTILPFVFALVLALMAGKLLGLEEALEEDRKSISKIKF